MDFHEKMAIVLQEVVGRRYHNRFYPTFSGVARSINFYPIEPEKPEDGIANIALGLGKYIVDGGMTLRFSPKYPKKVLQTSTPELALRETQRHYFALDLMADSFKPSVDDAVNLLKLRLKEAEKDNSMRFVASTYDYHSKMLRDGVHQEGKKLVTFSAILNHDVFPLAEILQELLILGTAGTRLPVEIEFAVSLACRPGERCEFGFLQLRPLALTRELEELEIEEVPKEDALCRSDTVLGHGRVDSIRDVVQGPAADAESLGVQLAENLLARGAGAEVILTINGSPYDTASQEKRERMGCARAKENGVPLVYLNMVGGQDELVFDGGSFVADAKGQLTFRAPMFEEGLYPLELGIGRRAIEPQALPLADVPGPEESVYSALVLGTRDYVDKHGFPGVVLGLSGGIDSALTSTLCALTGKPVKALNMPIHQAPDQVSRSARHIAWLQDRYANVQGLTVDLTPAFTALQGTFPQEIQDDLSMANTRSRLRMLTLYAVSTHHRMLVAGTGNKVEDFGVGFYTKYGDGGVDLSPIADLMKSEVYALGGELGVIEGIMQAPPTDGLWEDNGTDEGQIGASYAELEWAMRFVDADGDEAALDARQKDVLTIFRRFNQANRHKMEPIPVCRIPEAFKK